jgi:hypothetical protein
MAQFRNVNSGEIEFETNRYSFNIKTKVYKDGSGNQILSKKDNSPLELVPIEKDYSDPDSLPQFLSFGSMTTDQKKKILKERSKDDYKKNIEERKMSLQSQAVGEMKTMVEKQ